MEQWYAHVNGQQYGPVSREEMTQWVAQGRVRPTDYVWCQGMGNWVLSGSIQWGVGAPGLPMGGAFVPPVPGGTGGAQSNAAINVRARELLRGRWGLPIGFCLLMFLFSMAASAVPYVGNLISILLAGALLLGQRIFFLNFVRGGQGNLEMMFWGFKKFGTALGSYLLVALITTAIGLAAALPGIILLIGAASMGSAYEKDLLLAIGTITIAVPTVIAMTVVGLMYSQVFYVLADEHQAGAWNALKTSRQLMQGRKSKLFCLGIRYFGWSLLCILTLGIGFIWLVPYMHTGYSVFYDDLRAPQRLVAETQPNSVGDSSVVS